MSFVPLHAVAREPLAPSSNPPVLVLLHGLGADEMDLIGLAAELDPRLYVVSIRAPYETGYGGCAWFGIEFLPDGSRLIDQDQAASSLDQLIDELEAISAALAPSRLILGGFSQGAMMAAGVVLRRADLLDAAWLMSGRLIPSFDDGTSPAKVLPILEQHGLYDDVLPATDGRQLAALLKAKGHEVTFTEYPMAHQISFESLADANEWLQRTT